MALYTGCPPLSSPHPPPPISAGEKYYIIKSWLNSSATRIPPTQRTGTLVQGTKACINGNWSPLPLHIRTHYREQGAAN